MSIAIQTEDVVANPPVAGPPPRVFSRPPGRQRYGPLVRAGSFVAAASCLAILLTALRIEPAGRGMGTHTQLGMPACQFEARTGLPCATCGMTTSFSWFVRGEILRSLRTQPMGTILAAMTVLGFWLCLYVAATGVRLGRMHAMAPFGRVAWSLIVLATAAWVWKILVHLRQAG